MYIMFEYFYCKIFKKIANFKVDLSLKDKFFNNNMKLVAQINQKFISKLNMQLIINWIKVLKIEILI